MIGFLVGSDWKTKYDFYNTYTGSRAVAPNFGTKACIDPEIGLTLVLSEDTTLIQKFADIVVCFGRWNGVPDAPQIHWSGNHAETLTAILNK